MKYIFHPEAAEEFLYAIDYYEYCEQGLGYDFALEVYSTIQNILQFPQAWPKLDKSIRRCQTNRFPFGVFYSIGKNKIKILAVMHLHRDPDYWKVRKPATGS